jgi:F-type H+-transporting ATPase subunit alpha
MANSDRSDEILARLTADLKHQIDSFRPKYDVRDVGTVLEAADGIAQVTGLNSVHSQEIVEFANRAFGIAFNLKKDRVGVAVMGDYTAISEGMIVKSTGRIVSVPVGAGLIGRVVDALGRPLDDVGKLNFDSYRPVENPAPGIVDRQDVDTPLQTGIKAIDAMIPVGRGQRQLIIGDRQTGKTALAIDAIINQRDKNVVCIYVAIGQKKSSIARTVSVLERNGAMDHTIVVAAAADDSVTLQYIAPYAGCAIGEAFMEGGQDALIVYDDLSKHAWAYRELSLLMRRPPGREAYPGDIFYLHSRLLERAARLANRYVVVPKDWAGELAEEYDAVNGKVYGGPRSLADAQEAMEKMDTPDQYRLAKVRGSGGSLTALPIIETLLGDVSSFIPTNVISITDGQIYLEADLFHAGLRPAINVGISVSRVGGAAQTSAMKMVAGRLRLEMASYHELEAFAQFNSDLDKASLAQLERGKRLQAMLNQPQYAPVSLADQVIILYAGIHGYCDNVPVETVLLWGEDLILYLKAHYPGMRRRIMQTTRLEGEAETRLVEALESFASSWQLKH